MKIISQILFLLIAFAFTSQTLYGQKKSKEKKESRVNCWTKENDRRYNLTALEKLFLKYCIEGDTAKMSNLIDKGIEVNFFNDKEDSPIRNAITSFNINAVKLLLTKGSQVSFCYIRYGSFNETFTVYVPIIDYNTVLGTYDKQPSLTLKKIDYLKNVLDLISVKGYQVGESITEDALYKALFNLETNDAVNFYDYLKSKGMKTSLANLFQYQRFYKILENDTLFFVEMLKRGTDINMNIKRYDAGGVSMVERINPPLFNAVERGDLFTVKWMIEHGANVNQYFGEKNTSSVTGNYSVGGKNKDCTALIIAIQKKNMSMVKLLVEKGADVNLMCPTKNSPLSEAMVQNNTELIEYLIEKGAKN